MPEMLNSMLIKTPSCEIQCLLQALKAEGVDFIVAPYEADAQMAYLALNAMVDAVSHLIHSSPL